MEKVIRDSGIEYKGAVYNKCAQILSHADDIVIVGRFIDVQKETTKKLMKAELIVGVKINMQKTTRGSNQTTNYY
jgi:hypothetical protein